ncbi:MAG: NADP-dependent oxidoreductase, partial [Candidatus Eremiobacteraeota bacterium]|nr:NADP-dependent oxidoreductase [Candidatus Eremiobacteraeota bacterium]
MKAVRLHAIGGVQNLRVDDVEAPSAGAGEVLVRVRAAAL